MVIIDLSVIYTMDTHDVLEEAYRGAWEVLVSP
jgi:hypothetical protein